MKYVRLASSLLSLAGAVIVFAAVVAWQPGTTKKTTKENHYRHSSDTTVPGSVNMDQIDLQINIDSIMQEVNIALSKIDYAKMNADVQKAMAQIDYNKMNLEVNKALKEIDWKKMNLDVAKALDSAKMAVANINWDEIKANVARAQAEAQKAIAAQKINAAEIQKQVQKSLQDAQKNLQSAQVELRSYKGLKDALQKDGLIEEGKPYRIELKDGTLSINGVKQSKTVFDKYSRFYQTKKNFTIADEGGTDL